MLQLSDKEFTTEGNVDAHIAVHSMLAQQVDAELLASFGEAKLSIQSKDVGEDATPLVVMDKFEEFFGQIDAGLLEDAILCALVKVVNPRVLVVQRSIQ